MESACLSSRSNSRIDHKRYAMILAVRSRNFIKPDQLRRDPEEIKGQLSQGCVSPISAPKATFSQAHNYLAAGFAAQPGFIRGLISIQINPSLSALHPNWPVFTAA